MINFNSEIIQQIIVLILVINDTDSKPSTYLISPTYNHNALKSIQRFHVPVCSDLKVWQMSMVKNDLGKPRASCPPLVT